MNYGDIAVTGHPVEAGYDTANSMDYFVINGSINGSSISNLRNSSNVNVPGRWAFRVDGGSGSNKDKTEAGQVRTAKQCQTEVKKSAKDKAIISVSFRKKVL